MFARRQPDPRRQSRAREHTIKHAKALFVSPATHRRITHYAEATGVSLEHGTEEALQDWLDTVGDTRIQHARGQSKLPKLPEVHGWKAAKEKDPARGRLLAFSRAVNT